MPIERHVLVKFYYKTVKRRKKKCHNAVKLAGPPYVQGCWYYPQLSVFPSLSILVSGKHKEKILEVKGGLDIELYQKS